MKKTNRNYIKGTLARLLAEENIQIVYQPVQAASFDYKNRRLTLPILHEDITNELYNLMIGREAGRALYSHDVQATLPTIYRKIAPGKVDFGKKLYDIADGIRTERLVKKKYPGLARDFSTAYAEMFKQINKGDPDAFNPQYCGMVDRLNAYFRLGPIANIQFDNREQKVVDLFEKMVTSEDAIQAASVLRQFVDEPPPSGGGDGEGDEGEGDGDDDNENSKRSKKKSKKNKDKNKDKGDGKSSNKNDSDDSDDGDDGEGDSDGEDENDSDGDGKGKGDSKDDSDDDNDGDGEGDGDGEDEDDGEGDSESDADGDADEPSDPSSSQYQRKGGKGKPSSAPPVNPQINDTDMTDKLLASMNSNIDKNAKAFEPAIMPEFMDPNEFIVDYKTVHTRLNGSNRAFGKIDLNASTNKSQNLKEWVDKNNPTINMMVVEFERRKRATLYRRQKISKTGMIDTNRLQYSAFSEDVFRRITVLPEGKNHGMVMIIDWSESMGGNMAGTIEQLMNLVVFCRRRRIPHEVYAFSDASDLPTMTNFKKMRDKNAQGSIWPSDVKLLQFFSDTMSHNEYMEALANLNEIRLAYTSGSRYNRNQSNNINMNGFGLGGTPLNDAIIITPFLVDRMRERTKVEIMKTVILTDGASNGELTFIGNRSNYASSGSAISLSDRKTGFARNTSNPMAFTGSLIELGAKKSQCDYVGVFLVDQGYATNSSNFYRLIEGLEADEGASKKKNDPKQFESMKKNGFAVIENFGFSEYYILSPNGGVGSSPGFAQARSTDAAALSASFNATLEKKKVNRILLGRFIEKLAV